MRYIRYIAIIFFIILYNSFCLGKIEVRNKEINLGNIVQGRSINYIFKVKNKGDYPVNIIKVTPD